MNKKVLGIVIVLLVVAVGAAMYFFVFSSGGGEAEKPVKFEYFQLDPFVTNVKGSNSFFKATPVLLVTDKKLLKKLDEELPMVRDTILFILRDYTAEQIRAESTYKEMGDRIVSALNEKLGSEAIIGVNYFDYLIQG